MKKTTITLLLLFFATAVFAQDREEPEIKTLFGSSGIRSNGGYGGVTTGYTRVGDRDAIMIGGKGAWIVNHSIGIGLAGYGFLSEYKFDSQLSDDYQLAGGYGGLMFEFIMSPKSPIHVSFPVTVGAGGVGYVQRNNFNRGNDFDPFDEDSQAFFVVEPGVELELNLVRFMRLAFGLSYRYTSDINLTYESSGEAIVGKDALKGFSGGITLKFGKF